MKKLKTYECRIEKYFRDGTDLVSNHIAPSYSAARYKFWQKHSEYLNPYRECFRAIKSSSLGTVDPSQFYGSMEDFAMMCERRGIQFVYQGMIVDVAGRKGRVVGSNRSSNMDVMFEGDDYISNCHPTWETTFYDEKMNVVKDFKEPKPAIQTA